MNIAIVLKNWLGDVVFTTPAIRVIRNHFPAARIICIAPARCAEVIRGNPYVDEVIIFDERDSHSGFISKIKFILQLRKLKLDQAYLFHRSFTRALLIWLSGARKRIGYATKGRGFLLTDPISEPAAKLHSVDFNLELVRRSGLNVTTDAVYEFQIQKESLQKAKELVSMAGLGSFRLVAINPGANWPPKRWPLGQFKELAKELIKEYPVGVVITGSQNDQAAGDEIVNFVKDHRVVSFCGRTSLSELAALFSLCSLVISSDSGPLHIAGGAGANVLAIFGPTDPALTGPRGRGRNIVIHHVPDGETVPFYGKFFPKKGWMEHITVDEILSTIKREQLL